MSTDIYDPNIHSHVIAPDLDHPVAMVLHLGSRVWIIATYSDELSDSIQVGDGVTDGCDEDGNRILSIPAEHCRYMTAVEAEMLVELLALDDAMLALRIT
jgi:hypothetical protein